MNRWYWIAYAIATALIVAWAVWDIHNGGFLRLTMSS